MKRVGYDWLATTGVCIACYRIGARLPAEQWCFASEDAYDESDPICARKCPDRKVCGDVVRGRVVLQGGQQT